MSRNREYVGTGRVDKTVNPLIRWGVNFGHILRRLRTDAGVGIKRLGPELGVSYSYVSKLENGEVSPSEELIGRISAYFHYDRDRLLISAGKVPPEVLRILQAHPEDAVEFLRQRFGGG